ncbi:MAG: hypothetical protein E5Y73_27730 [Mesorhizobium sp.]|uniref:hypothetical protein n=1 Tax=Mesorhizobium sp. TaxID=1871066 RepID=UPI0011F54CE9|nr:hypothetical protein [Mesorhizobium sp.]TIL86233.1 MAG: hypothetical protein E5Y73_27730 [Mesorhizobium sp.]TIR29079.1 MAG: hypothetical protein E5X35_28085 [Mesorhizobium sp.]
MALRPSLSGIKKSKTARPDMSLKGLFPQELTLGVMHVSKGSAVWRKVHLKKGFIAPLSFSYQNVAGKDLEAVRRLRSKEG